MARKNQKKRNKNTGRNFPVLLVLVLLGGGLLLLAAVLLANRTGGGTPSIAVDQQKIDYGYVKFGESRSFAVKVTNTGDGPLRFKDQPYIEVLEGC